MNLLHSSLISSDHLVAVYTQRTGGVSKTPYESLNLAFHVGDELTDVIENHNRLAKQLGYERQNLIHMRQIHSDRICEIDKTMSFDAPPECDALITNLANMPLMVMSADCTPILLHDPVSGSIGAVHAGRAGALSEILPKTIHAMHENYGSRIEDMLISFGPSIHGCCYEINESIAQEAITQGYDSALRYNGSSIYLDVNTILKQQLNHLNFPSEHLEVIDACTSCQSDRFFSYRAAHRTTGRIAGVIMLRS